MSFVTSEGSMSFPTSAYVSDMHVGFHAVQLLSRSLCVSLNVVEAAHLPSIGVIPISVL